MRGRVPREYFNHSSNRRKVKVNGEVEEKGNMIDSIGGLGRKKQGRVRVRWLQIRAELTSKYHRIETHLRAFSGTTPNTPLLFPVARLQVPHQNVSKRLKNQVSLWSPIPVNDKVLWGQQATNHWEKCDHSGC